MWKRLMERLFGNSNAQQQTVKTGQVQIQSGRSANVKIGGLSVSTKGNCSLTIENGKVVVEADNPVIKGPGADNVIVRPAKK